MTYGYNADIIKDLDMQYMSEDEFIWSVMEELEKPALTQEEYEQGIQAIKIAERKALVMDLVENWDMINSQSKSGYETLDYIINKHQVYDMREFDLILDTVDRLFKL